MQHGLAIEDFIGGHEALRHEREEGICHVGKRRPKGREERPVQYEAPASDFPDMAAIRPRAGVVDNVRPGLVDASELPLDLAELRAPGESRVAGKRVAN